MNQSANQSRRLGKYEVLEVRRHQLEKHIVEIEDALDRDDSAEASARAAKGLEEFPDDRRLLRLKALADKKRAACEMRMYVESHVSLARRLLEEKKLPEALAALQEPLSRYPDNFTLRSLSWLITDSLQRERSDEFRTNVISQARDAIQRKAYNEAIDIVQAARWQTSTDEFDGLLQLIQENAANNAKQQKVDTAVVEARRLMAADDCSKAIELLESTLRDVDDLELRIVLTSERLHIEQFLKDLKEVLANGRRLLHVKRYREVIEFLEGHTERFGRVRDFSRLHEQVRVERRRVQAFSSAQERARNALEASDFEAARAILAKYCQEFGDNTDSRLIEREIHAKHSEAAREAVAQALRDCRILRLVGSFQAVLDILAILSAVVALVPAELQREYQTVHATALEGAKRERLAKEQRERFKQQLAEGADQPTLTNFWWTTMSLEATKNPEQETQLAKITQLENVLREVTLIGDHYREDRRIKTAVDDVRYNLSDSDCSPATERDRSEAPWKRRIERRFPRSSIEAIGRCSAIAKGRSRRMIG